MDPPTLCRLAASCEEARQIGPNRYEGRIRARVAVVSIGARIEGVVLEMREPHHMVVDLTGNSTGMPGTFSGRGALDLEPVSEGTRGRYTLELDVLGRLGALGAPFFQLTAQRLANTLAAKVSDYLQSPGNDAR